MPRALIAALDAWSYRVAQGRAQKRRVARSARPMPALAAAEPRWPTRWGD